MKDIIGKSVFLGSLKQYYVLEILQWIVSIATATLLLPYTVYHFERWRVTNSQISGKRLLFKGKLWHAYGIFLIWLISLSLFLALSNFVLDVLNLLLPKQFVFWAVNLIVLFLNTYLLRIYYRMWVKRCLAFAESIAPTALKSMPLKTMETSVKAWAICTFSLKLASPHAHYLKMKHFAEQTMLSGKRLKFEGGLDELYKVWWQSLGLCLLTLGLYLPVLHYKIYCWRIGGLALTA